MTDGIMWVVLCVSSDCRSPQCDDSFQYFGCYLRSGRCQCHCRLCIATYIKQSCRNVRQTASRLVTCGRGR